jgi:hypothetical protein
MACAEASFGLILTSLSQAAIASFDWPDEQ